MCAGFCGMIIASIFMYTFYSLFPSPFTSEYFAILLFRFVFGWQTDVSMCFFSGLPFYYYNFVTQFHSTDIHTLVFEVFALVSHRNFRWNIDFCKWKTFVSSTTPLCIFRSRSFFCSLLFNSSFALFFSSHIFFISNMLYSSCFICGFYSPQSVAMPLKHVKQTTTKNYIRNECNQSHTLSHSHTLGDKSDGGSWTKMHGNYFVDDKEL